MPQEILLVPSLKAAAHLLWEELRSPTTMHEHGEDIITDRLRHTLELESTSCEALATARGDALAKHGDERGAEVCYGIAGAIRRRREEWLKEVHPF